jgi:hypothetical protein
VRSEMFCIGLLGLLVYALRLALHTSSTLTLSIKGMSLVKKKRTTMLLISIGLLC